MPRIDSLLPKLRDEADKEYDMFAGDKKREFFIEIIGAESVDDLLKMYEPDEHNQEWDKERQKDAPNIDTIMLNRRAIAFMVSGKMGVFRRYKETELRAHVMGQARMAKNMYMLDRTDEFTKMELVKQQ